METYILLMGMTEKGLDEIHKIPATIESLKKKLSNQNIELKGFYKVMGDTDYVAIIESKGDVDALSAVMAIGKIGYFTTLTLKAYTMEQMKASLDIYQENFS